MDSIRTSRCSRSPLRWITLAICIGSLALGCERKERVIDIKTPGVNIEINKTKDGIEVETKRPTDKVIDIDVPGAEIEIQK